MAGSPFKRIRPGGQFSARDENLKGRAVEAASRVVGGRGVGVGSGLGGVRLFDNRSADIWIKITGAPTGASYPFSQVYDQSGTVLPQGISGTVTVTPAVEINGLTTVANGTIKKAWPRFDGQAYLFDGAAGGGETDPLTTKGDIECFSTVVTRQPVGINSQFLAADSTQATGLKWKTLNLFGDRFVTDYGTNDGNALANVATPFALTELVPSAISPIVDTTNATWTQDASHRPKSPTSGTRDVFASVTLVIGRGTVTAGTIYLLVRQAATTNFPTFASSTNTQLLGVNSITSAELAGASDIDVAVTASGWMTIAASTPLFVYTCLTGASAAVTLEHCFPLIIQDEPFMTLV